MVEAIIQLPISEPEVRQLRLGDTIYLSGQICTARDKAHIRALELLAKAQNLPVELNGGAIFHCGPIMKRLDEKRWEIVAAGPTTSSRLNALEPQFIEKTGVRAIIGKGGMDRATADAMKKFGCVYLAFPGGAGVVAAKGIKRVLGVEWYELGMPEALWILEAEKFGPLLVAIDAHGNSLYEKVEDKVKKNIEIVRKKLGL